jgi:hypothetical protein
VWGSHGAALAAVLAAAVLWPPIVWYRWDWELSAAFGWAACLALVPVFRLPRRDAATSLAFRATLHRLAGYAVLGLVALHVGVMLAADPFVLDYLGWLMPAHVLAGVLGVLALLLAVATREPALRLGRSSPGRVLHLAAGLAAGGLTSWHVLASTTKLITAWPLALAVLVFVCLLAPALRGLIWPASRHYAGWRAGRQPTTLHRRARPRDKLWLVGALAAAALVLAAVPQLVAVWRG